MNILRQLDSLQLLLWKKYLMELSKTAFLATWSILLER